MGPQYEDDGGGEGAAPTPRQWAGLVLKCVRRRKLVAALVFLAGIGACFAYVRYKRPVYRVQTTILAQRQAAMPSTVRPSGDDSPTRFAWQLVHRRENLLALVDQAGLVQRPPSFDSVVPLPAVGAADGDDPRDLLVRHLDQNLAVTVDDGTVTLAVDWPDPQQAYLIVQGALQNFIEARHLHEVTAIDEVISVLRGHVETARQNLEQVMAQVQRDQARDAARVLRPIEPAQKAAAAPVPSEDLVRLRSLLDAKQRAIQDVEEFRRRRLAEVQAQLDERRNTLSDQHPSVMGLKRDVETLSRESPQIGALREEEAQLRKEYNARVAREGFQAAPAVASRLLDVRPARERSGSVDEDERVRDARFQYQRILDRVNSAQLELDAVRAAFKFRYNVIWPPEEPKAPVSPDPFKVFGLGLLGSLLLAIAVAAWPDLRSGRILERWQVERALDLPILAELPRR